METFRKIFFAAALAGLIAGIFIALVHQVGAVPIILKAETYEKHAEHAAAAAEPPAVTAHDHDHAMAAWEPENGLERTAFTAIADILTGIGFSLLLVSAYALRGEEVDWRKGLYWGLAGFATFTLAPGIGLPPEVPGTAAAPLLDRQIWWIATAVATGGGLALLFFKRKPLSIIVGVALIVLPHLYGAPQPAEHDSLAPLSVAHAFVVAAVVTSFLFWVALGSLSGFFYKRIVRAS